METVLKSCFTFFQIPIPIRPGADGVPKPQISAKEKQEILELVAEKMDEAFPNVGDGIQTRDFSNSEFPSKPFH
jgi:hypothetical protein